MKASLIMWMKI